MSSPVTASRNHATQGLRERATRLRAIVNTAGSGIITMDAQGIIETCNPEQGFEQQSLRWDRRSGRVSSAEPQHGGGRAVSCHSRAST